MLLYLFLCLFQVFFDQSLIHIYSLYLYLQEPTNDERPAPHSAAAHSPFYADRGVAPVTNGDSTNFFDMPRRLQLDSFFGRSNPLSFMADAMQTPSIHVHPLAKLQRTTNDSHTQTVQILRQLPFAIPFDQRVMLFRSQIKRRNVQGHHRGATININRENLYADAFKQLGKNSHLRGSVRVHFFNAQVNIEVILKYIYLIIFPSSRHRI